MIFVSNRFKLNIPRKKFRSHDFNLRKITIFEVNLNSLAFLPLLTSKMLPNRGDLSSIHHFPHLTWELTSINDPFRDHLWAWLTKKVVNLTEINLNLLTLLWASILAWRRWLTSIIPTSLESWGNFEYFCKAAKSNDLTSKNKPNLKMKK